MAKKKKTTDPSIERDIISSSLDQSTLDKLSELDSEFNMLVDTKNTKEVVSFGSLKMDIKSGIGGACFGKLYEFIGWESCSKSSVAINVMANAQKMGKSCLLIDGEHSFDPEYAKVLNLDVDDRKTFAVRQPTHFEQAMDYIEASIKKRMFQVVVIDSQTSLMTKKELEAQSIDSVLGVKARIMSSSIRKLVGLAGTYNVLIIIISQLREKIGVMFGSNETTSGGNALKFYSHVRLDFRKSVNSALESNVVKFKFIKNKLAAPFGSGEYLVKWGQGVDNKEELIDLCIEEGLIKQTGAWFLVFENVKLHGRTGVNTFFEDNPEAFEDLKNQLYRKIKKTTPEKNVQETEEITSEKSIEEPMDSQKTEEINNIEQNINTNE